MTTAVEDQLLAIFLLFCRLGGCFALAPGLAGPRIPVQVRLFAALAMTTAVAPLMLAEMLDALRTFSADRKVLAVMSETLTGLCIGLMARLFMVALQFAATAASNFIGLAGIPGIPLDEGEAGSPVTTLASAGAVVIIVSSGLHVELLRALLDSYSVMQIGSLPLAAFSANVLQTLGETTVLALRLTAPFMAYGVIVNLAIGLGNRFAQQLSVYHASTGVVILGGFVLLHLVWQDWMTLFISTYSAWLVKGGFG